MKQFCDLHTHSVYSDGTVSPAEIIRLAKNAGLAAVALCDHNTIGGLAEFVTAAKNTGVEAVPGIEFSTDYLDGELHILGLFIPERAYDAVSEKLQEVLARKEQSNIDLIKQLQNIGIELDYDAIKASMPGGMVNRAVIAAEMVRKGYVSSIKEAFSGLLSPKRGYYHPPKRIDAFEAIRFIKSIGAVSVLAHPFLNLNVDELRIFLQTAVQFGLDGMETHYSTFTAEETAAACRIAEEFGLLQSGGSDFHGMNKPDICIGTGKGTLRVPMELLEGIRGAAQKRL